MHCVSKKRDCKISFLNLLGDKNKEIFGYKTFRGTKL